MILHSIDQALLSGIDIPERMNNPLDYQPHPLCIAVCKELQTYLSEREDWREEIDKGKMFGILIVENAKTEPGTPEIGYLAAYSGQIGGRSDWDDFVPAVFDYLQPDGYFKTHEAEISDINQRIRQLEGNEHLKEAKILIQQLQEERKQTIAAYQEKMKEAKAKRDARRKTGNLTPEEEAEMVKESQFMKAELRRLKKSLSEKPTLETEYEAYQADILRLKQLRKTLSDALQQWLFSQFRMQNHEGKMKDLQEIFRDAALRDYPQATLATSRIAALKMVTSLCRWRCSGGAKVRRRRFAIICSSILPAMANASRYCIGCCRIGYLILKLPKSRLWKSYMKTTSWQSSTSLRDCCRCRARIHPSHPSIPSCGRNIQRQPVR